MTRLVVISGPGVGAAFDLGPGATLVGRRPNCGVRLASPTISRVHCRLTHADGAWRVEDLSSTNGTFINGVQTNQGRLAPGDVLRLGACEFRIEEGGQSEPAPPVAVPVEAAEPLPVLATAPAPSPTEADVPAWLASSCDRGMAVAGDIVAQTGASGVLQEVLAAEQAVESPAHTRIVIGVAALLAETSDLAPAARRNALSAAALHDGALLDLLRDPGAGRRRELRFREADARHAAVGAERCAAWGLPEETVAAVRLHHSRLDVAETPQGEPIVLSPVTRLLITAETCAAVLAAPARRTRNAHTGFLTHLAGARHTRMDPRMADRILRAALGDATSPLLT